MYHAGHNCSQWITSVQGQELWPPRGCCVSGQGHLWDVGPDRHHSSISRDNRQFVSDCTKMWHNHYNNAWITTALIHFYNHINLFTNEEVQFLRKYHLSIDASNPYFVLDKKFQGYVSLKGIAKESESISPRTFKNLLYFLLIKFTFPDRCLNKRELIYQTVFNRIFAYLVCVTEL